jgi:hypothetical protein
MSTSRRLFLVFNNVSVPRTGPCRTRIRFRFKSMCGHSKPNCYMLVADPEGKLRMEAFFCTDLQATPVEILP